MVRLIPEHACDHWGSMPLAFGLFISVSAIVALCAKHKRRIPHSCKNKLASDSKYEPKSSRHLASTTSNKANPKGNDGHQAETEAYKKERGFGEDGLWQKAILMGEKCRPPEFSGAIHYDSSGNQLHEPPPMSPRASPLPSFSFPVANSR